METKYCFECNNYLCRCADCFALVEKTGDWFCDLKQDYCKNISGCNEYNNTTGCDNKGGVIHETI